MYEKPDQDLNLRSYLKMLGEGELDDNRGEYSVFCDGDFQGVDESGTSLADVVREEHPDGKILVIKIPLEGEPDVPTVRIPPGFQVRGH